ncbi:hypothetical protein BJ741DRAFT_598824 [Chytriomyces cf. hyalinus JEL632]|nr:hypothetical protein BJ741DRAFT_598824 [Chytriomyces cf. hyalinus JEL632]
MLSQATSHSGSAISRTSDTSTVPHRIRKQHLNAAYAGLICMALLFLLPNLVSRTSPGRSLVPEFGMALPANSVASLRIESVGGVGHLTVKVLQGTGTTASFMMEIESTHAALITPPEVMQGNQSSDGAVQLTIRFPPSSWLPFFQPSHRYTLFVNLPIQIAHFAVRGPSVNVVYMGPNITESISIHVKKGSIKLASPISMTQMDISTNEGSIAFAYPASVAETVHLKTGAGELQGRLTGFSSLYATNKEGDFDMQLQPQTENAAIVLNLGAGTVNAVIEGFSGKLSLSYDPTKTPVTYGEGLEWPPISSDPFLAWVNGIGTGRGVCNITLEGSGGFYVQFPKVGSRASFF